MKIKNFYIYNTNLTAVEQYQKVDSLETALRIFVDYRRGYGKNLKYIAIGADYEEDGISKALDLVGFFDYHNRVIQDYKKMNPEVTAVLEKEIEKIVMVLERVEQEVYTPEYTTLHDSKTRKQYNVELLRWEDGHYRSYNIYKDIDSLIYYITENTIEGYENIIEIKQTLPEAEERFKFLAENLLHKRPIHICSECGEEIYGDYYVVNGGFERYCSEECILENYDEDEWEEMLEDEEENFLVEM